MIGFLRLTYHAFFSPSKDFAAQLKQITGYYPIEPNLYKQAFRHASTLKEGELVARECNERLEYLGDAVLSSVVAEHLFKKYPLKNEGFLTEMRSKIVNREMMNKISVKLGLDQLVQYETKAIHSRNQSLYGNALEAFIGALYLDRGYEASRQFIIQKIVNLHLNLDELESQPFNFKSKLMEFAQKHKIEPIFEIYDDKLDSKNKRFRIRVKIGDIVLGEGSDLRKKSAEQKAAEEAYLWLQANFHLLPTKETISEISAEDSH